MRIAVLSDIHANLAALESVLEAVDAEGADEVWCLGDIVGYGPRPNECCAAARDRFDLSLAGNHDLASIGQLSVDAFNGDAAAAVRWTGAELDADSETYLASLVPTATRPGVELFHGSPLDPVWDYVITDAAAFLSFRATRAPLVLVGHSHVALALSWALGDLGGGVAPADTEVDLSQGRWLLNPGSVGQPRGGDWRASWLLLDEGAARAIFRRVAYPLERTQAEIRARGLPDVLAARLALGE
jgi:predicted phosphodiesterase